MIALLLMAAGTCPMSQNDFDAELVGLSFSTSTESITSAAPSDQDGTLLIKAREYLPCGLGPRSQDRCLDVKSLERWRLAAKGFTRLNSVSFNIPDERPPYAVTTFYPAGVVTALHAKSTTGYEWRFWKPVSTRKMIHYLNMTHNNRTFSFTTIILPLIYGGVHLAALDFAFPSLVEGDLWKVCSLAIISLAPATLLTLYFEMSILGMVGKFVECPFIKDTLEWAVFDLTLLGSLSLFAFSRAYLVIESFISLRDLPLGAFAATPWLQAVPHI